MTRERSAAEVIANECLCFRARRVSRVLTRMYDEALRPLQIQATQLTLLSAIALRSERSEHGGTMGELAGILSMDRTTVSRNVRTLEQGGSVRIEPSPDDGRVRIVGLTPEGEQLLERALPLWKQAHRRVVATLGPEAAAELRDHFDTTVTAATEDPAAAGVPTRSPQEESAS